MHTRSGSEGSEFDPHPAGALTDALNSAQIGDAVQVDAGSGTVRFPRAGYTLQREL